MGDGWNENPAIFLHKMMRRSATDEFLEEFLLLFLLFVYISFVSL